MKDLGHRVPHRMAPPLEVLSHLGEDTMSSAQAFLGYFCSEIRFVQRMAESSFSTAKHPLTEASEVLFVEAVEVVVKQTV